MLVNTNRSNPHQKAVEWRADKFIGLRGFMDGLLHKTDFRPVGDKKMLDGAYFVKVKCELSAYEAAQMSLLREAITPKVIALHFLNASGSIEQSDTPRSTGAVRAARLAREQDAQAQKERQELIEEIRVELERTDAHIRQAYSSANVALARYSKAAKFRVINEEIPHFDPEFSPNTEATALGIEQEV